MRVHNAYFFLCPLALSAANAPNFTYSTASLPVNAIATDAAGNTYLGGGGEYVTLTATPGAFQSAPNNNICGVVPYIGVPISCSNAFVIKLNPAGAVVFATYVGGSGSQWINGIAVDRQGNVYVAGGTSANSANSNTFPVTPGAAFTDPSTARGFIAKLNPSGSQLGYSTFIPAASVSALTLDSAGNLFFAGTVTGPNPSGFPATPGAFQTAPKGSRNIFPGVAGKLNASGSALIYGTYLSGGTAPPPGGEDSPGSIAVDASGNAFIAGWTSCTDFPVTSGAYLTSFPAGGQRGVFLTKLNPQGSGLVYSTFVGQSTGGVFAGVDAQGTAFVAGTALIRNRNHSGVLVRISADGSSLLYAVNAPPSVSGLSVDSAGNAVVAGTDSTGTLPVGVGAFQPAYAGGSSDAYVARYTPEGELSGATYAGGSQTDTAGAVQMAANGSIVLAGYTNSPDFPGGAPPPGPGDGNFVTSFFPSLTLENAASFAANEIAPGEIVSLQGYGIGPTTGVSATGSVLPTELGGVEVSMGGFQAPLLYVQSRQINAQVPWELASLSSTTVQVSAPGLTASAGTPVAMAPSQPGIFYVNNSDGTQNSASNPAKAGDFVSIYGTGGGLTDPVGTTGAVWPVTTPPPSLNLPVSVSISGESAQVVYAGASPLNPTGIFQINVLLPKDLQPSSTAPLSLTIGNSSGPLQAIAVGAP